jgi:YebC/PmpR family DNA-binding regulatory protein
MSGHSKWAQIKRQKGVNDARRGQLFTKLGREITVAAREGGADPDGNFRLRLAMQRAREANMPADNVERAVKRGTGASEGASYEEMTYEGYGPGGTAVMVEVLTDNKNRTVADIRSSFTRGGGNLGESGCVAWMFTPRGIITVDVKGKDPDEVTLLAIDAGAEDVVAEDGQLQVITEAAELDKVRRELEQQHLHIVSFEQTMEPSSTVELSEHDAAMAMRLIDRLEELDDVQSVHTNAEFSEQAAAQYSA